MGLSFFGLPRADDPTLGRFCATQQMGLLSELRSVAPEVGGLAEARRMPSEVRRWWLSEMYKEADRRNGSPDVSGDGRKVVRDVPRRT